MTNTDKKISLSLTARRIARIAGIGAEKRFRVFDLVPEWRPSPHDIQISVQRYREDSVSRRCFIQFHQRFVLKLHLDGESEGYVENRFLRFRAGEGILVFPFETHRITGVSAPAGQLRVLANFTLPLADQLRLAPLRGRLFPLDAEDLAATERLVRLSASPSEDERQQAIVRLADFLVVLRSKAAMLPSVPEQSASPSEPLFACIRARYREGLSVKELAAEFGVSEVTVRRMFLRETGRTPGHAIRELRLKYAAEELRTTRRPIGGIAESCGFSNMFSFSRAFRNRFGVSPRAFRNGETGTLPEDEE